MLVYSVKRIDRLYKSMNVLVKWGMCITKCIRLLFDDKRYTMILLLVWMIIACSVFYQLGAFHMHFMTFGPSSKTIFMGMTIDTWNKWYFLAAFSFVNTATNEFLGSALLPWFQNTIQDHKSKYIPYSQRTCMSIVVLYDIYAHVMSIFGIYLLFSQIDFLIIRLLADILVTVITTNWFLQYKSVDEERYLAEACHLELSVVRDMEVLLAPKSDIEQDDVDSYYGKVGNNA
jgi:hypothetical protein